MATRPARVGALVAGADGCPGGWVVMALDLGNDAIWTRLCRTAEELVHLVPEPAMLAVDIPIGLPERGPRACDVEAARLLGPARRSCVFPAPIRPALGAPTRRAANALTRGLDGRGVSAQSWSIVPRIATLDRLLSPALQRRVVETHPELAFLAWNGGRPLPHAKDTDPGRHERVRLINNHFGPKALESARAILDPADVADDDLHDAFAALWTADRIVAGTAVRIPADEPPADGLGLRMEMWY